MRRRGIIAVGGGLTVAVAAALVGGDRWRRLARELDQRSSPFSPRGSGLYGRVAPRILRGFYRRVTDVAAGAQTPFAGQTVKRMPPGTAAHGRVA
jgi:hypothetical protein